MIFVFGSNLAGAHGLGAALIAARQHGAKYGRGNGHHGNSYAIPTKDAKLAILPIDRIKGFVDEFIAYAIAHPELAFQITQIGCGHSKYTAADMAPMFVAAPDNCQFDSAWQYYLEGKTFWGTYENKPAISRVKE
jgi:hypothetical protein